MPLISVIVPVYKVEIFLKRCIDSILEQTFTNFEIILVDDGSPDNCGSICDEYALEDDRIHVIHRSNGGLSAARNTAINWVFENSDSEFISFIDSDDWVHPRFLELLYKGITSCSVRICQCRFLKTDGFEEMPAVNEKIIRITPVEHYSSYYSAAVWNKLFARSCWSDIRFPEGQLYEDVAIWYKILFAEQEIALVDEILYYYYQNSNGIVLGEWTPAKMAQIRCWDEQISYLQKKGYKETLCPINTIYVRILMSHLRQVGESSRLSKREKKHYCRILRRRLNKTYPKSDYNHEKWVIEQAHPIRTWIYWTTRGVLGKIKKLRNKQL